MDIFRDEALRANLTVSVVLHRGYLPAEEGWYYCLIGYPERKEFSSDMVYFDGEWCKKGFEEILFWTEPLEQIIKLV